MVRIAGVQFIGHADKAVNIEIAERMVHDSLDALVEKDCSLANHVLEEEKKVDAYRDQIFRVLLTYMMADPGTIQRAYTPKEQIMDPATAWLMTNMLQGGDGSVYLTYFVPTRGLLGFRSLLLTQTRVKPCAAKQTSFVFVKNSVDEILAQIKLATKALYAVYFGLKRFGFHMHPWHPRLKMFDAFGDRVCKQLCVTWLVAAHDQSFCFNAIGGI